MNKKNIFIIICIIILSTITISGCLKTQNQHINLDKSSDTTINGNEEPATVEEKKLDFVTLEYPPFEYYDNGEVKGIAVDIVKEACKRLGYNKVTITVLPFERALVMVKEGQADGIFTCYKTLEREEFLDYSQEVLINQSTSLFALKDSKIEFDGDLSKLKNYTIGVAENISLGSIFDKAVKDRIVNVEASGDERSNMEKLLAKRIDFFASSRYVALYICKNLGKADELKEYRPIIQDIPSYIGFSKKRPLTEIRKKFDKTIADMKKDGTYDKILTQY